MKAIIALVVGFVVSVSCIPLKPDDTPKLKKEMENIANNRLQEWNQKNGDKTAAAEMLVDLLKTLQKAETNNNKALPGIEKLTEKMAKLDAKGMDSFWGSNGLRALTAVVDGNRDNISYYTFEAARLWIEKRLPATKNIKAQLEEAMKLIITARDALDSQAQVFVKSIKNIREWTKHASQNAEKIRSAIKDVQKANKETHLPEKTTAAINKVHEIINSQH